MDGNGYLMEQTDSMFVSELEAELTQLFEQDDRQLGLWLDWCLDHMEASLDEDTQAWVDNECASFFEGDSISHIPSADQAEPSD